LDCSLFFSTACWQEDPVGGAQILLDDIYHLSQSVVGFLPWRRYLGEKAQTPCPFIWRACCLHRQRFDGGMDVQNTVLRSPTTGFHALPQAAILAPKAPAQAERNCRLASSLTLKPS
jgi:hypothetical protein